MELLKRILSRKSTDINENDEQKQKASEIIADRLAVKVFSSTLGDVNGPWYVVEKLKEVHVETFVENFNTKVAAIGKQEFSVIYYNQQEDRHFIELMCCLEIYIVRPEATNDFYSSQTHQSRSNQGKYLGFFNFHAAGKTRRVL